MLFTTRASLPLLILLPLAACSGGGGSGNSPDPVPDDFTGRGELFNTYNAAFDEAGETDPSALPVAGSAAFSGVALIQNPNYDLKGRTDLAVDFADNEIAGTASDFRDGDDVLYDGVIVLDGTGQYGIDRNAAIGDDTFSLDMDGTLQDPVNGAQTVNGVLLGDFARSDAEYLYADSEFVNICDVSAATCVQSFTGIIARDRD